MGQFGHDSGTIPLLFNENRRDESGESLVPTAPVEDYRYQQGWERERERNQV